MTTPRLQELYDAIKTTKEEIATIRQLCKHAEYEVGYYEWAPAHMNIVRICKVCDASIPGISDKEYLEFQKEHQSTSGSIMSQADIDQILTTAAAGWGEGEDE